MNRALVIGIWKASKLTEDQQLMLALQGHEYKEKNGSDFIRPEGDDIKVTS